MVSSSITVTDENGDDVTTSLTSGSEAVYDDTKLGIRCIGGVETYSPYTFDFKILTSLANKWEIKGKIRVED